MDGGSDRGDWRHCGRAQRVPGMSSGSKVTTLRDAVETVPDGAHVALGGFAITRNSVGAVHELIRAGRRGLTLTQVIGGMDTDLLVGAGCVDRLAYSGGSLDRFGFLSGLNDAIATGRTLADEHSSLSLALRLHAGAMGLPFMAAKSMLGSALLAPLVESGQAIESEDPFTGAKVVLLAPIRPDVAFVHADRADPAGNAAIAGPTWSMRETAFAARRTIVTCEELVEAGSIGPDEVLIPGAIVAGVVELPRGAHPTSVYGRYDYDRAHLEEYATRARAGAAGLRGYIDEFVRGTGDHAEYLARVGGPRESSAPEPAEEARAEAPAKAARAAGGGLIP